MTPFHVVTPTEPSSLISATIEALAALLQSAERPLVLVGRGVLWSKTSPLVRELARVLPHLRVSTTPGAKGCFPESHPQCIGVFGFGGGAGAATAVTNSDAILVIGSRLLEQSSGDWHPAFARACVYRIDLHARQLAATWDRQVPVEGDIRETLSALLAALESTSAARGNRSRVPQALPVRDCVVPTDTSDTPLKPQVVMSLLNPLASTPICADAGNSMCWAIEQLRRDFPDTFYVSLDWGTMGFALPGAIGVCMATGKHAIALTGDGSMAMSGGELHTAVECRLPVIVVVLNDSGAGMVRAGTALWFKDLPELPGLAYQTPMDLAGFGASLGARSARVTNAGEFRRALSDAMSHAGPTLIDVIIDSREVPPAISSRVKGLASAATTTPGGGIC